MLVGGGRGRGVLLPLARPSGIQGGRPPLFRDVLRELVRTHVILAPSACWGGAGLRSVDGIRWIRWIRGIRGIRGNPRMESFFRVLGMKNNENEHRKLEKSILLCFLAVFAADFSFSLFFTIETADFLIETAPLARHRPAPPPPPRPVQCAHCTVCSLYSEHTVQ